MWIVELAIRRPYTFVVVSMLIAMLGVISAWQMPVDIFPNIDIPVVGIVWSYTGLSPEEMESRIVTVSERAMTTVTGDIEHMESTSMLSYGIIKVFMHRGTNLGQAVALMSSVNQTILKVLPPGITPPLVIAYSASDVPVMQLGISSPTLTEAQIYDYDLNFIRTRLATVGGASIPLPFGGKQRQVMVDLYPQRMLAKSVSPADVVNAMSEQNIILPAGDAKIGTRDYLVRLNSSPILISEFNELPVKQVNDTTIYMRDIGNVHDGYATQLNVVRMDGHRATLLNILRSGGRSTLAVVQGIKETLPLMLAGLPKALKVNVVSDQSVFVKGVIEGVIHEAVIAAVLTGLLMLAILGSWRSTIIVATSIPLSILFGVIALHATGQTLNTMTLGGLALAVGMLVDDATVEVENIHRNLSLKLPLREAVLTSASQIALPALVSTSAICIVFIPVALLPEPERSLFVPLGMAVVFSMAASYFLSRTLVPVMAVYLLGPEEEVERGESGLAPAGTEEAPAWRRFFRKIHAFIDGHFNGARDRYHSLLNGSLKHRNLTVAGFAIFFALSFCLIPLVGMDFFPNVDAGQLRLHVITPVGSRIEKTEMIYDQIETEIRKMIDPSIIAGITYNIGIPASGINLAYGDMSNWTTFDGEMLITLNPDHRQSIFFYQKQIRQMLAKKFPQVTGFFQSADINSQILNMGLQAPIDIQVTGRGHAAENYKIARAIRNEVALVPGAVDVLVRQVPHQPQINVDVDRTKAVQMGLTQRDVSSSVLTSLSSSFQTTPSFWVNYDNGVNYLVAVQTPPYRIQALDDIRRTLITGSTGVLATTPSPSFNNITTNGLGVYQSSNINSGIPSLLMNLASTRRSTTPGVISHYQIQPVFDVFASAQDRDLGGIVKDIKPIVEKYKKQLPPGGQIIIRGQATSMNIAFLGLGGGLVFSMILIYMLLVVNFQSWLDPFIILMAIPGAFCGIVWALFVTQTTFSVPALMGAIMSVGVASSNSILMVSFANDEMQEGRLPLDAASQAGFTRFRPVVMTATAMIIGMLPMSLGLGAGGAQNAPLGRAVIGGLLIATIATLLFVPNMFVFFKQKSQAAKMVAKRKQELRDCVEAARKARRERQRIAGIIDEGEH